MTNDHTAAMQRLFGRTDLVGSVGWADLKHAINRVGIHFFDVATMRAFKSRTVGEPRWVQLDWIPDHTDGPRPGRVVAFVTSERDDYPGGAWNGIRRYTLRYFDGRQIRAVGKFGEHATRSQALAALAALPRP